MFFQRFLMIFYHQVRNSCCGKFATATSLQIFAVGPWSKLGEVALRSELEVVPAKIPDLQQRVFGRNRERSKGANAAT